MRLGAIAAPPMKRGWIAVIGLGLAALAPTRTESIEAPRQWAVASGEALKYERLYGKPLFISLEILVGPHAENVEIPSQRAIRTSGFFSVIDKPSGAPQCSLCTETNDCLPLDRPTADIADVFFSQATFRNGDKADVVGAFSIPSDRSMPTGSAPGRGSFVFWSFDSGPAEARKGADGGMELERLVRSPRQFEGRSIVVRGQFRGANLFEDMPAESRLAASDWVLRDGPFFIWVTGRAPRGKGFSLDLGSRASAAYRLEVEGRPRVRGGLVYLKASEIRLLGKDTTEH